jgi:hypothetical protein
MEDKKPPMRVWVPYNKPWPKTKLADEHARRQIIIDQMKKELGVS